MSRATRIQELIEQLLESQRTPEEVCRETPELLWEVRERYKRVRSVEEQIDAMFPPSGPLPPAYRDKTAGTAEPPLPKIEGYDVQNVVARGGMGVVYKARHLKLNRHVALKMLLAGPYASAAELARFLREAEAVASLTHANIVQVHDVGDIEGRPFFTMEFIEGGSLAQKLGGVPQRAAQSATMLATLAEAVSAAHQHGIVHRDLKPGNILLTADGTPKIADFGLARYFEGDGALTLSGVRIGTPSYMSPEQAVGKHGAVGPAADIYSLGAILYEMLTGRPPFRAETPSETQRQLVTEEPVAPSRLNAKVPRDLETICLKCLRKEPHRRYESAAALTEDLHRFLRHEPIVARPVGWLERTSKWVQRRPAIATVIASAIVLSAVLVGGGVWLTLQRGELRHAVEADLKDVANLQADARWPEARIALERAEARLGQGGGSDELRQRFIRATNDLDLVIKLDAVRLTRITSGQLVVYRRKANERYAAAFKDAGLGRAGDDPQAVAARVKGSAVRAALVAALDDWVICAGDAGQRNWLLDVSKQADPDATGWRDRLSDPTTWENPAALSELVKAMPMNGRPLSLLLAVGDRLRSGSDGDAVPFLRRVQQEHPDDFWANVALGNALLFRVPAEARGYYRAALSSRPDATVGYCAVGDTLRLEGSFDEAIHYYRKSIERDAKYARGYTNLGLALQTQGKLDEAIECYRKSLELDPDYAWSYYNLGNSLRDQGHDENAVEQYRKALALEPRNGQLQNALRTMLMRQGRGEEVWSAWHVIIETDPPQLEAWWGYAELTLFLGKTEEYRRARQGLLRHFGDSTDPLVTEKVARACLLLPGSDDELSRAVALADRALAAKDATARWYLPYFMFAKGFAEYRQGHFDSAISIMQGDAASVLGPAPRLVMAMAQQRQGNSEAARSTLAAAIASFDWDPGKADSRDVWLMHLLRREAEATILAGLPTGAVTGNSPTH